MSGHMKDVGDTLVLLPVADPPGEPIGTGAKVMVIGEVAESLGELAGHSRSTCDVVRRLCELLERSSPLDNGRLMAPGARGVEDTRRSSPIVQRRTLIWSSRLTRFASRGGD